MIVHFAQITHVIDGTMAMMEAVTSSYPQEDDHIIPTMLDRLKPERVTPRKKTQFSARTVLHA